MKRILYKNAFIIIYSAKRAERESVINMRVTGPPSQEMLSCCLKQTRLLPAFNKVSCSHISFPSIAICSANSCRTKACSLAVEGEYYHEYTYQVLLVCASICQLSSWSSYRYDLDGRFCPEILPQGFFKIETTLNS